MIQHKIIRSGNSLAITIPAKLVKTLGVKAGDLVNVQVALDQSHVTYHFVKPSQLSLSMKLNHV